MISAKPTEISLQSESATCESAFVICCFSFFSICLLCHFLKFCFVPLFELPNCFPKQRQFNVAVKVVGVFVAAVAHQFFADILDDSCFKEPGVERRAQILKPVVLYFRAFECSFPGGLNPGDWIVVKGENQTLFLFAL